MNHDFFFKKKLIFWMHFNEVLIFNKLNHTNNQLKIINVTSDEPIFKSKILYGSLSR